MSPLFFVLLVIAAASSGVVANSDAPTDFFLLRRVNCESAEEVANIMASMMPMDDVNRGRLWLRGACPAAWLVIPPLPYFEISGPGTIVGGGIRLSEAGVCIGVQFDNITFDGAGTLDPLFANDSQIRNVSITNSRFKNWVGPDVIVLTVPDALLRVENVTMEDIAGSAIRTAFADSIDIVDFTCNHCAYEYNASCVHLHMAWWAKPLRLERASMRRTL
jgi:hypothetical protein